MSILDPHNDLSLEIPWRSWKCLFFLYFKMRSCCGMYYTYMYIYDYKMVVVVGLALVPKCIFTYFNNFNFQIEKKKILKWIKTKKRETPITKFFILIPYRHNAKRYEDKKKQKYIIHFTLPLKHVCTYVFLV